MASAEQGLSRLRSAALRGSPRLAVSLARGLAGDEATWLRAVALGAHGRYGAAHQVLATIGSESPWASLADSTAASLLRQIGRHADAHGRDIVALERARATTDHFEALLGLAADAVGLGDYSAAEARWDEACAWARSGTDSWRHAIRLGWVEAEIALLDDRPRDAADAAARTVSLSVRAGAERHRAKSLLFEGVARADCDERVESARLLRASLGLSERLGAWPLVWPAASVAARLVPAPEAVELRRRSAVVVAAIDSGLLPSWRSDWRRDHRGALAGEHDGTLDPVYAPPP